MNQRDDAPPRQDFGAWWYDYKIKNGLLAHVDRFRTHAEAAWNAAQPSDTARKFYRAPSLDKRIGNGDDFAGDAWVCYTAVGHTPDGASSPNRANRQGNYIVTSFVYPPIPDRNMDWQATLRDYDGAPDSKGPCSRVGRGPTETAAVADLLCQIDELQSERDSRRG